VSDSLKQTPRDLRDVIENFDELEARLAGTPHYTELHELGS